MGEREWQPQWINALEVQPMTSVVGPVLVWGVSDQGIGFEVATYDGGRLDGRWSCDRTVLFWCLLPDAPSDEDMQG
jgi:hypothetical protein